MAETLASRAARAAAERAQENLQRGPSRMQVAVAMDLEQLLCIDIDPLTVEEHAKDSAYYMWRPVSVTALGLQFRAKFRDDASGGRHHISGPWQVTRRLWWGRRVHREVFTIADLDGWLPDVPVKDKDGNS